MSARARRQARVDELLDWVGLTSHAADARLRTYSKGMLQRVGIAQALVHDPRVVFLDEPMSGLDPIGRKEIRDLILRLRSEGKTVFMNTHILPDVEMVCDRVAIIVHGRIRYEGSMDDVPGGRSATWTWHRGRGHRLRCGGRAPRGVRLRGRGCAASAITHRGARGRRSRSPPTLLRVLV